MLGIHLYFSFIFTFWTYHSIGHVIQQYAVVEYYDEKILSEAKAFTSRQRRGAPYLTNVTYVTRHEMGDNVTIKIRLDVKNVGSMMIIDKKMCDCFNVPWMKKAIQRYSNMTVCPLPAGRYKVYNLEIPPKEYPLPVPKGEGSLHFYCFHTQNKKVLFHVSVKVFNTERSSV